MISVALVAGLAGLWLWEVLNDEEGILGWLHRPLMKTRWTAKWMRCPWCSGAWFAGAASLAMHHDTWPHDVVMALAAAAVTGVIGSTIDGD